MPALNGQAKVRVLLMLGLMTVWSTPTWAQVYSCTTSNGTRYQSRNPCPKGSKPPPFTYHGPKTARPHYGSPAAPSVPRAGEELAYMGSRCASMQEAVRTAPARGIDALTIRELRRNFELECQDERRRAQQQLSREKRDSRQLADERLKTEKQHEVEVVQAGQKLLEQCAEMRRSLQQRKQRPSLSEGETRDLALFQDRYQQRCVQTAAR